MQPWVLESWTMAPDRLSVTLKLRARAMFHDGSPVTAESVVATLQKNLPAQIGDAFHDVSSISAVDASTVQIALRRPSQFVVEALEMSIQKPGAPGVGTGPYVVPKITTGPVTLLANPNYYMGRPAIDRIVVTSYPTARAAWAEMLRGGVDMLNDVNIDALDSLQESSDVKVFTYLRHYQYMLVFGTKAASLRPPEIRRALSAALDRDEIVREALNGHGVSSAGPVPPQHWTMSSIVRTPPSKQLAKSLAAKHLKFTCLVPPDTVYERIALVVKRQLAAVSVEMELRAATQEEVADALRNGTSEALLADVISGPTLFRSFRLWSSEGTAFAQKITSAATDEALSRISHAVSDDDYRKGVEAFQLAITDDPPALFLAWGERARAVSRRFTVPQPVRNEDILDTHTLRQWRPSNAPPVGSTN